MTPIRVQLSRRKGWRMPPNTISVARPGRHGNPFKVVCLYKHGPDRQAWGVVKAFSLGTTGATVLGFDKTYPDAESARAEAVAVFRAAVHAGLIVPDVDALRGHNQACWCPLDGPCHADVLLELANG